MSALPTASPTHPLKPVDIVHDLGGKVFDYEHRVESWRREGTKVRIEGLCASACTLALSLPPENVCVAPGAALGFHAGSDPVATVILWHSYPKQVQAWLAKANPSHEARNVASIPLTPTVQWLADSDLQTRISRCT